MDIKVGSTPPAAGATGSKTPTPGQAVEARLLAIRMPRKRGGSPPPRTEERREAKPATDPPSGRVLVLMIPDGGVLPRGIENGEYRVFLRFVRR